MKFIDISRSIVYYMTTEDGIDYRCGPDGKGWERRYGESWEPVLGYDEEKRCYMAWAAHITGSA